MSFVIMAPPYVQHSAGIIVLHELRDSLEALGHKARMCLIGHTTDITDEIVIYPEVVTGNPLNAKRVVRYFLNKETHAAGNHVEAGADDFILTYSKFYRDKYDALLTKRSYRPYVEEVGERTLNATYIGKGSMYRADCYIVPSTVEIGRTFPATKTELYDLLKKVKFFFTWDSMSGTNDDAIFCGAIPVFMTYHPFTEKEFVDYPHALFNSNGQIIIADNFNEQRKKYVAEYNSIIDRYEDNLKAVVAQIQEYFYGVKR